ncbi:MAG: hypothetical protein ABIH23_25580 [bacterium]
MGTNFYFGDAERFERIHIGKRSAAGLYCWDCGITLCKRGDSGIHTGISKWHKKCPKCGKEKVEETLDSSSAGRELGFNKTAPGPKVGVASCCSFSWAISTESFDELVERHVIIDEYLCCYTREEFQAVLSECPVQFFDSIGTEFS